MSKMMLHRIILVVLISTIAVGVMYFSGCAPTVPQQKTVSPERQKAIQDSITKAYKFELMKQWSTGYEYYKQPESKARAIRPFRKVMELDTIDMFKDVYAFLSDCYFSVGAVDSAEMVLTRGIEKYPDNVGLLRNRAYILAAKEMLNEAIADYEKVVELDGTKADDWKRLGQLYIRTNEIEKAKTAYEKIVALDPDDKDAQTKLATLYMSTGDADAYLNQLIEAEKRDPNNTQTMYDLASEYYKRQEYKNAITKFNEYLAKKPDDYFAMETLGMAYYGDGQYRSAIATYKKIVAAKPKEKKIYCDIATNYRMLGELRTARTWANKAIAIDKQFGLSYIVIGEVYESAVDQCLKEGGGTAKFMDKLVYRAAYQQYKLAARDLQYVDEADRKMNYLKDYLPTKEDEFFNKDKKEANGLYKVTKDCYKWIADSL
ncbi:tetratricopeptide repeat protein [candidate division KSB1 bacterium]|nr:tetratricopeptide repeat protein [candidate division KSB1 bacterium]